MNDTDTRSPRLLRGLLIAGTLGASAVPLLALPGDPRLLQDTQLTLVLQAMALIKGALVLGLGRAVWARARWPLAPPAAASYLVPLWLMAGASAAIWQLNGIALAAAAFHLGLAVFVVAAWRDRGARPDRDGTVAVRPAEAQPADPPLRRAA